MRETCCRVTCYLAGLALAIGLSGCGDDAGGGPDAAGNGDQDDDGYADSVDCDDSNPSVHPEASESCNGLDDDCDGRTDEVLRYADADGDGYGFDEASTNLVSCDTVPGYSEVAGDCDDQDAGIHPGIAEVPGNAVDEDCDGTTCAEGERLCTGTALQECRDGRWAAAQACPSACSNLLGCVTCLPDAGLCDGDTARLCLADGSGWIESECDPIQGSSCDGGRCIGACAPETLGSSYIGCDYYPTVTRNAWLNTTRFEFAIVVSNTSAETATVTVTQGDSTLANQTVAAGAAQVITLPWTAQVTAAATSLGSGASGAYRLRSTQPVTVYQFNPLQYASGGEYSYTNDASLLLPVTAWGLDYVVAARGSWDFGGSWRPGFYAVVAAEDGTSVTLTPSATGGGVIEGGGIPASGSATTTLNGGESLQVLSAPGSYDLTGTRISADKPIQVLGGHDCAYVPANVPACDHLEEAMFPVDALANEYLVAAPWLPTMTSPKAALTRIVATEPDTTLTYDPAQADWPTTIAAAGDYVEVDLASEVKITADRPVLVAQYMKGQEAGGSAGDPAMTLVVPVAQYRTSYLFHAPVSYDYNYVNVTAPMLAQIVLDGTPVEPLTEIGSTGYGFVRVALANDGTGDHLLTADQDVGISVYGYGQYTSHWYPGGLDLAAQ